jgi:hypothetical protein
MATTDPLRAAITNRLQLPPGADLPAIMAAQDRMLAERPTAEPQPGTELVDSVTLNDLRTSAEAGRVTRTDMLLRDAVVTGRIPPAAVPSWRSLFTADPVSTEAMLRKIPRNTVPI